MQLTPSKLSLGQLILQGNNVASPTLAHLPYLSLWSDLSISLYFSPEDCDSCYTVVTRHFTGSAVGHRVTSWLWMTPSPWRWVRLPCWICSSAFVKSTCLLSLSTSRSDSNDENGDTRAPGHPDPNFGKAGKHGMKWALNQKPLTGGTAVSFNSVIASICCWLLVPWCSL